MNDLAGYLLVMKHAENAETFDKLALLMKEAEADQKLIIEAEAKSFYYRQKYPDCLKRIDLGLRADSSNRELLKLQAKTYFEMAMYKEELTNPISQQYCPHCGAVKYRGFWCPGCRRSE